MPNPIAREWLSFVTRDLEAARTLGRLPSQASSACFHAQQAGEKALTSRYAASGGSMRRTKHVRGRATPEHISKKTRYQSHSFRRKHYLHGAGYPKRGRPAGNGTLVDTRDSSQAGHFSGPPLTPLDEGIPYFASRITDENPAKRSDPAARIRLPPFSSANIKSAPKKKGARDQWPQRPVRTNCSPRQTCPPISRRPDFPRCQP